VGFRAHPSGGRNKFDPGSIGDLVINPGRPDERHILKATRLVLKRGDVIRGCSGGGDEQKVKKRARITRTATLGHVRHTCLADSPG